MRMLGGRYRLIEPCGSGGMAVVWRAYDDVLDRDVAVKVIAPELADDPDSRARVHREARAAAGLAHPNITGVFDFGVSPDQVPYVVMELLDGPTLAEELAGGPLPPARALSICADVAAGLAAAHAAGVIHRDVKPANVMLTSRGVKVLDFGIAAAVGARADADADSGEVLLGTLAYMSPERLLGRPAVPATDVYSLGMLLYRCVTGEYPWTVQQTEQLIAKHVYIAPVPLPPMAGVPTELIMRCLAKAPEDRPTAAELAGGLRESSPVERQRRRGRFVAVAAGAAATLALVGAYLTRGPAEPVVASVGDGAQVPGCKILYRSTESAAATVTVTNTGPAALERPTLLVGLAGQGSDPSVTLQLRATVPGALAAGGSATLELRSADLTGKRLDWFMLDGVRCPARAEAVGAAPTTRSGQPPVTVVPERAVPGTVHSEPPPPAPSTAPALPTPTSNSGPGNGGGPGKPTPTKTKKPKCDDKDLAPDPGKPCDD